MTDIHSHILFGVDDGSKTIEESISLLKELQKAGFDKVILTPHFIMDSNYNSTYEENYYRYCTLKDKAKELNLKIEIYLGNEIFIHEKIPDLLDNYTISSLNDTNYVLVEFPFHNKILNLEDILYHIESRGYKVVIAHPERYTYFQKDYSIVDKLRKEGFLFQSNYSSIIGAYGKESEKLITYMLKKHYIDFLGTDIHRIEKIEGITHFLKIKKKIIKITGEQYWNKIINNGDKLTNR